MYFDRRLWRFTEGVRGDIAWSTAIGLMSALAGIARLALLGWLIAAAIAGRPAGDLALMALATAASMFARAGFDHWRAVVANRTAARVQSRLRLALNDQLMRLGPARIGAARSGDMLVVLTEGVEQLHTYFGRYLPQLAVAALTPVAIFAFLAFLDLPVALVMLAAALATLLAPAALHRMNSRSAIQRSRDYKEFAAELLDSIQGLATLKAFGQSAARARRMAELARQVHRSTMWVLAASTMTRLVTDFGIAVGAAGALALGVWRVSEGAMPFASLVVVLMLGVEVFRPLRELRELLHTGMLGQSSAEAIIELLAQRPTIEARPAPAAPRVLAPTVSFEDVRFAYPGGRGPAHRGMSFAVAAGERVGIVGPSGSGKSTIMRLLLRFHDPQSGVVRLGSVDLRELSLDEIRRHVAVVGQDTMLFHGSIAENLRLAKPDASAGEIEAAARAANAHGFITRLPQGYATVIGERGLRLSGGQRQRIAIARALLRDAPILVLDEALSAVDAENEAVIQQALDRLMQGRTTLIFAHRLSSVIGADRILALGDGGVAESGRHGELMARRGAYYALMREQAEGDDRIAASDGPDRAAADDEAVPAEAARTEILSDQPADDVLRGKKMGWLAVIAALLGLVRPWRAPLAATLLLGIARVAAFIGVGVLGAMAVRAVQAGGPAGTLLVGLAAVSTAAGLLHWAESWLAHDVAFRLLAEMRIQLFAKLDTLAPAYLLRRRSGDLVAMATHDIEMVEYFFAHTLAPAFVAVLVPAAVLAALGTMHPWLALALLPFLLLAGLGPVLARRRIDALGADSRSALGALNAHAVDTIQGIAEIAAFQAEPARRAALAALSDALGRTRTAFMADLSRQSASLDLLTGLGGLAVVLAGAALAAGGAVAAGLLPLAALLAMAAFLPVSEIAQVGRQLADTLGATQRLAQVHEEKPVVADGPRAEAPPGAGVPALALDRVRFRYPAAPRDALVDAGFAVPAGATVALVGPSGAGKTTIAQLLLRFWDPAGGTIRLNGVDLRELELDALRSQIALVAQDTYLFNDDLEANIRIGRPDATDAELAQAVERAALAEFVASLPDGLKTRVGERGMQLSGGQRQRIAIARALLKNAPVLVLDEATSHLDAVSERAVRAALDALKRDRTTLVIAHRLSTVRDARLIVVLDEGRVREAGTHGELLARRGLYARLIERQAQSVRAAE
ncbi:MAG: ABC transporter ATP-binding protein/permease [Alphaproteobacteria bacterium]|nr:ABC transporter ATP-binding protein/permease [Alphaproteobacteria bacterium]